MTDNAKFRVARLDEIEKRGSFIPVREHLGIHSFGINARTQGEDGASGQGEAPHHLGGARPHRCSP